MIKGTASLVGDELCELDQQGAFQILKAQERHMRRIGTLQQGAQALPGAGVTHRFQLIGLMGDVTNNVSNDVNEQRMQLQAEGKNEAEIEKALRSRLERKIKGG